eukprot:IDg8017t1
MGSYLSKHFKDGSKIYSPFRNTKSLHLHRNGSDAIPPDHEEQIAKVRTGTAGFDAANIYNVDDSNLLFKMGPNRSYLSEVEKRASVCGTAFQKHKERRTTVFAVNCTGSHILPMRYIGQDKLPELNGIAIVLISANTTAVYQLLDKGLILMMKIQVAINLVDAEWAKVPVSAIARCWLKSKCLDLVREHTSRELLPVNDNSVLIEQQPIYSEEARQILC